MTQGVNPTISSQTSCCEITKMENGVNVIDIVVLVVSVYITQQPVILIY